MTTTSNTNPAAGFDSEDNDSLPSAAEQAEALENQLDLSSYDPSTDPLLADLPQLLADKGVDPLVQAKILEKVGKKEFPLALQYELVGSATTMTLGQLASSRANEHAQQFLYPTSIKKILFGKYGIAKGKKLSSNIEVSYFRDRETGEYNEDTAIITSGRHRVTAIIALLQFLGVKKWQEQRVIVIPKVVNSDPEFAQLIETANDSRKMPRAEQQVHGLTRSGVNTHTSEKFYETRLNAGKSQLGHCFAKAVQFELAGLPQTSQDSIIAMVGSAWNKVAKVSKENRDEMERLIVDITYTDQLKSAAREIASKALSFTDRCLADFPNDRVHVGAPKVCAIEIAEILGLTAPTF